MKKNDWIILTATATYCWLFYNQHAGINVLLFALILIILMLLRNKNLTSNIPWILASSGILISATCVFMYGNTLSFLTNIISVLIASSLSFNKKTSWITSVLHSLFSIVISFIFIIENFRKRLKLLEKSKSGTGLIYVILPLIVLLIFFFIYKESNAVFSHFTDNLNLDFISIPFIFFMAGGFLIIYGLFFRYTARRLRRIEGLFPDNIADKKVSESNLKVIAMHDEKRSATIILVLLNLLLLLVNALDVVYLWKGGNLPAGMTYAEFVHQGTGALIFSILLAILIILFYFRKAANFAKTFNSIKLLASIWLIQNIFMAASTAFRNNLYIIEYSLTYKRIGVYVWLMLSCIGLVTTLYKIFRLKTNWYLVRINSKIFYTFMLASCAFNWDSVIAKYNIENAHFKKKKADKIYLASLSSATLPYLFDELNIDMIKAQFNGPINNSVNISNSYVRESISSSLYNLSKEKIELGWQSNTLLSTKIFKDIEQRNNAEKIRSFYLYGDDKSTLQPLLIISNLNSLQINSTSIKDWSDLTKFKKLKSLSINNQNFDFVNQFPELPQLQYLEINGGDIIQIKNIDKFTSLEELCFTGYSFNLFELDFLKNLKKLKKLHVNVSNYVEFLKLKGMYPDVVIKSDNFL